MFIVYMECMNKGYYTPNQKLTCFVLYLEIINTFLKKIIYASYNKSSEEFKNSIEKG